MLNESLKFLKPLYRKFINLIIVIKVIGEQIKNKSNKNFVAKEPQTNETFTFIPFKH